MFNLQNVPPSPLESSSVFIWNPIVVTVAIIIGSVAAVGAILWLVFAGKPGKPKLGDAGGLMFMVAIVAFMLTLAIGLMLSSSEAEQLVQQKQDKALSSWLNQYYGVKATPYIARELLLGDSPQAVDQNGKIVIIKLLPYGSEGHYTPVKQTNLVPLTPIN